MGGRKHLLSEDPNGKITKLKIDPKFVQKQIAEEAAKGNKAYVVDDDELIHWGKLLKKK